MSDPTDNTILHQTDVEAALADDIRRAITAHDTVLSSIFALGAAGDTATRAVLGDEPAQLSIPTFDGNPDVTHPSVVKFDTAWNGYRYWMAFTPFPDQGREQASVAASNDGNTWVVPAGLTNPVATDCQSDNELVYDAASNSLRLFYRIAGSGAAPTILRRRDSTNGTTWTNFILAFTDAENSASGAKSPAIVWDGAAWRCYLSAVDMTMFYATSATLTGTFTGRTVVTMPAPNAVWHHGITRTSDGTYHLFYSSGQGSALWYAASPDGVTFTGTDSIPAPLLGGYGPGGQYGWYRPFPLIAVNGPSPVFEIFTSAAMSVATVPHHRIFRIGAIRPPVARHRLDREHAIWLPATRFIVKGGAPNLAILGSRPPAWMMDSATVENIITTVWVPSEWINFGVDVVWANVGAGAGDVRLTSVITTVDTGLLAGTNTDIDRSTMYVTATAGALNVYQRTRLGPWGQTLEGLLRRSAQDLYTLRLDRIGNDAADTLANDIGIIGCWLYGGTGV